MLSARRERILESPIHFVLIVPLDRIVDSRERVPGGQSAIHRFHLVSRTLNPCFGGVELLERRVIVISHIRVVFVVGQCRRVAFHLGFPDSIRVHSIC